MQSMYRITWTIFKEQVLYCNKENPVHVVGNKALFSLHEKNINCP